MKKINYKLINTLLLLIIILLLYKLFPFIKELLSIVLKTLSPLLISFIISYSIYPITHLLEKKLNKTMSYIITISLIIIFLFILIYLLVPIIIKESYILLNDLISIIPNILNNIPSILNNLIESTLHTLTNNLYNISINLIKNSISFIINIILITILSISFLINMENIRKYIKTHIKNKKLYTLIKNIDKELLRYIKSIFKIIIIETTQYTLLYYLIGHPYYYILGLSIIISIIIPYIAVIFINLVAFITAINISKKLFILTIIISIFTPIIDNYIIEPKIIGKTTKLSFIEVIISLIISSSLFKTLGLIIAVPLYIIVKNIIKYLYLIYNKAK